MWASISTLFAASAALMLMFTEGSAQTQPPERSPTAAPPQHPPASEIPTRPPKDRSNLPVNPESIGGQASVSGVLTCNVSGGFGFIFGSSRAVNCTYAPTGGGPPQHYVGAINKFGVDIGYLQGGVIIWTVVAPTANLAPGSLSGTYAGATGSATVGVGVGANVLVGGSGNSIALQPVSIEGSTGLNVAAGIAGLTLTYQPG
jgi:hypothetical protein